MRKTRKIAALVMAAAIAAQTTAFIGAIEPGPAETYTAHTFAIEPISKSGILNANGTVNDNISDYFAAGVSKLTVSAGEISAGDVVVHAGIYIYNDPGSNGAEFSVYPSDPSIKIKAVNPLGLDASHYDNGVFNKLYGHAYDVKPSIGAVSYQISTMNSGFSDYDELLQTGGSTGLKTGACKGFASTSNGKNRAVQSPTDNKSGLNPKDYYFGIFDIVIPRNTVAGSYTIAFDAANTMVLADGGTTEPGGLKLTADFKSLVITVEGGSGPIETDPTTPAPGPIPDADYGDVNLDGRISMADVVVLGKRLAGKQLKAQAEANANVYKPASTSIDIQDLQTLIKRCLGDISSLPVN